MAHAHKPTTKRQRSDRQRLLPVRIQEFGMSVAASLRASKTEGGAFLCALLFEIKQQQKNPPVISAKCTLEEQDRFLKAIDAPRVPVTASIQVIK